MILQNEYDEFKNQITQKFEKIIHDNNTKFKSEIQTRDNLKKKLTTLSQRK
jgi:hypothetical protein